MYFHDRAQAGKMLANDLRQYRYRDSAVLALSPGGVLVGEQIAISLHATLSMLMTESIFAPSEPSLLLGTIDQDSRFTFNNMIPAGLMEEYMQDMRGYLEEERQHKMYQMSRILGEDGFAKAEMFTERHVIITTDGVKNGTSIIAALNYLKYIPIKSVVVAIPVGPSNVIERIGHQCDHLRYLYIPQNFLSVKHYYEEQPPTDRDEIMDRIKHVMAHAA